VKQLSVELPNLNALKTFPLLSVYGASEFLDQPVPAMKWLIPGLIPQAVPSVLASKGGLGKSFISLQMCICLATGKPFLDYDSPANPVGAVYFGLEDSKDTFHRRLRAIVDAYRHAGEWSKEDDIHLRNNFSAPFVNWQASNATTFLPELLPSLERILATNAEYGVPPGIMIIDTLARVSEGDENTVQALRPILTACNRIAHHGTTPLVLHHVGKGQDGARLKEKPTLADRMSTEWVRGSSAIVDNFRCILQLAAIREDEADGAGLDTEKARSGGYLVLGTTKLNSGMKGDWRFLEQGDHGAWALPPDGHETLAKLRGRKAVTALNKQMQILTDLYEATRCGGRANLTDLSKMHFPDREFTKARNALDQAIHRLRKAGYLQVSGHQLTVSGVHKIQVRREEKSDA